MEKDNVAGLRPLDNAAPTKGKLRTLFFGRVMSITEPTAAVTT